MKKDAKPQEVKQILKTKQILSFYSLCAHFFSRSGDCAVQAGPRRHGAAAHPHHRGVRAARWGRNVGGDASLSEGAGGEGGGSQRLPGRWHHIPSAAQRTLRHWRTAGEMRRTRNSGMFQSHKGKKEVQETCPHSSVPPCRVTLVWPGERSSWTLTAAGALTEAGLSLGRTTQRWTARPPTLPAGWPNLWWKPVSAGESWSRWVNKTSRKSRSRSCWRSKMHQCSDHCFRCPMLSEWPTRSPSPSSTMGPPRRARRSCWTLCRRTLTSVREKSWGRSCAASLFPSRSGTNFQTLTWVRFLSQGSWPEEADLPAHRRLRPLWSWRLFMGGAKEAEILTPPALHHTIIHPHNLLVGLRCCPLHMCLSASSSLLFTLFTHAATSLHTKMSPPHLFCIAHNSTRHKKYPRWQDM